MNHLSAVADSIGMLTWVEAQSKPYKTVDESYGTATYMGNRVVMEFKEK
jgi:adenylyl cyclase-associated protein